MKTKFLSLFVALIATTALWAGNTIIYTADAKLQETTNSTRSGLHVNAFDVKISSHTFSNSMGTITFAGEVTIIGYMAFNGCSGLTSVTIPNSVTTIGDRAFRSCSGLTSVTIPNSVTTIESGAFRSCSGLTSVTIGNSVTTIGEGAFRECYGLTSVTIPNSVTEIGYMAFSYCSSLTSVTIPNSVKMIGYEAFSDCSSLTSVTIPNSVKKIGDYAFSGCASITSMTSYANVPPTCGTKCFNYVDRSIPVYVPAQSLDAYKQADTWKEFWNIQPIEDTGIEELFMNSSHSQVTKLMKGGQLLILHNGKMYNAMGGVMR